MEALIEINNIETIPNNTLTIFKDNLGENDIYSLCLKDNISERPSSIDFRLGFVPLNNVPMCVLMIKIENKIYKRLLSFEITREFEYLKNLLAPDFFNLYLFSNEKEIFVFRIENKRHKSFLEAADAVKENLLSNTYNKIVFSKEDLLNRYTDEELWSLAK